MFSKKSRLSKEAFSETFKSGRKISNRFFTLVYKDFLGQPARYAVVVSKKVAPKATARNAFRRRVFAALRAVTENKRDGAFIFLVKKEAAALGFEERKKELFALIEKILDTRG